MALESSSADLSSRPSEPIDTTSADAAARAFSRSNRAIHLQRFDNSSERDWYALVRDMVALANSGGGRIACEAPLDERELLAHLDRCTDAAFRDVRLLAPDTSNGESAVIEVGPAVFPVGLLPPAAEAATRGSQQGDLPEFYFRHGERSERATSADMRAFVERLLRRVRRRWLRGIRRALARPLTFDDGAAPKRAVVKRIKLERAVLQPVRIVSDPNAPALQPQDVDRLYPWRQKDLLQELNNRLGRRMLTTYDVQAVRRHHQLDDRPDFVFHLPGAGRRYSPALADWILEHYARNPGFFHEARVADQEMLKLRRKKPR
jgi:hypothetical protein